MTNIALFFFPNIAKRNKKNGKTPIYLRLVIGRGKSEARLDKDYDIEETELIKWNPASMRLADRNCPVNNHLDIISSRFSSFKKEHEFSDKIVSPKFVVDTILGKVINKHDVSVFSYMDSYYATLERNTNFTASTKRNYRKSITHLKSYLSFIKEDKLRLTEFNSKIAENFKEYLESDYPEIEKKGMKKVSSSSIIKCLKPIVEKAVREEIINKSPFEKIKMCKESPNKKFLTITQIVEFSKVDLSKSPSLIFYRDFFLFCIYTGLSFTDAINLSPSLLNTLKNGFTKLDMERAKTKGSVQQILNKYALEIIEKYKKHPSSLIQNSIFPKKSYDKINSYIKIVANRAGIQLNVSTSMARNTCRQLLAEAGIEDYLVINTFMGWSSNKMIHSRYYQVTESKLLELNSRFEYYLDKNLNNTTI